MHVTLSTDAAASNVAAAIGEPARARMLYCLVDGRARTSTELAMIADVSPSTASVHLARLKAERLVNVSAQGKHRYYSLGGADVAAALEALNVLTGGGPPAAFVPTTPESLRAARTCYDHIAGLLGVSLFDRVKAMGWVSIDSAVADDAYRLTATGVEACRALGMDVEAIHARRRRFAYACVDWSERRPHLGGALGAALLDIMFQKKWMRRDRDSRALLVTGFGRRELLTRFGLDV